MTHGPKPSLGQIIAGTFRFWAVYCLVFFVTFPWWSHAFVAGLRFVLEGLNGFGQGWR